MFIIFLILILCLGGCASSKKVTKQKGAKKDIQTGLDTATKLGKDSKDPKSSGGKRLKQTKAPEVTEDIKSQTETLIVYYPEGNGTEHYIKDSAYFVKDILDLTQRYTTNEYTVDYKKFNYDNTFDYCSQYCKEVYKSAENAKSKQEHLTEEKWKIKSIPGIKLRNLTFYDGVEECTVKYYSTFKMLENVDAQKVGKIYTVSGFLYMSYVDGAWGVDSTDSRIHADYE